METVLVLIVSTVGLIVSSLLLVDAYRDRQLVFHNGAEDALVELTTTRIVNEWVRWILQAIFLICAVIFGYVEHQAALRELAVWLLISLPIILMVWSLYIYARRHRELRGRIWIR